MGFVSCVVRMGHSLMKLTRGQEKTILKVSEEFQASRSITKVSRELPVRRSLEVTTRDHWSLDMGHTVEIS